MIVRSTSNIDIIQGVIGYGNAEGITDWRFTNTNTGILNILNSTSTNVRVSMLENGNVGIGTTNPASMLDVVGDTNITGIYKKNNRDVVNETSNYVLLSSNLLVPLILREVGNGSNYVSRLNTALNTSVDNTSNYVQSTSNIFAKHVNTQWTNVSLGINYSPMVFTYTTETAGAGTGQTLYTITVPDGGVVCDILVVAGGGGGGSDRGGGGGGGGVIYLQNITLNGTYTINVGKEGLGTTSGTNGGTGTRGTNGKNSTISGAGFTTITAIGGGGGGGCAPNGIREGLSGGSGGGGSHYNGTGSGGTGTSGQGSNGGIGFEEGAAGGGGGAVAVGNNANSTNAGNGGLGLSNTITGSTVIYGSGGGGGGTSTLSYGGSIKLPGTGGSSGAGNGGGVNVSGVNATIYGCGGGGGGLANGVAVKGGDGGPGIVIIRYLTSSKVGIGTTNPVSKLHIYDDTISNTKLTIQNNFTQTVSITSSPSATTTGTTGIYTYMVFTYTTETAGAGSGQTEYTICVPASGYTCDILIVGGGGTGGGDQGGGGGGGGLVYITSENLAGIYNIKVGRGGTGISIGTNDGNDSSFGNYIAKGGGGGGFYTTDTSVSYGRSGGSGGGGGAPQNVLNTTGGSSTQQTYSGIGFGNIGGGASANVSVLYCGGGGGAGEPGVNGTDTSAGRGGDGKLINITGQDIYYAGGGGGSIRAGTGVVGGLGGLGGGGNGTQDDITVSNPPNGNPGKNALPNTGGGGGGVSRGEGIPGGSGGSGIVIIRYITSQTSSTIELLRGNSTDTNIDYKIGNYVGDFKIISSTLSVDTDYIRITSNGASIYNPTGSPQWSTVSDRRIKENIEKASYDKCYDNINKLELYRFNYIAELKNINKDLKQLGYIAQEVQDIFPKAVSSREFNNDNLSIADMLSIDITQINYSLYGAVKKLIEIYNDIENNIKILENILEIDNTSSSNIIIQDTTTSNIIIDTATSNVAMDTISSNIVIDTISSNVIIDTSMLT